MTTTRKPAAASTKKAAPAKPKATAKATEAAAPAKPMTRTELLAALAERKYTGPVSFTAMTLREVVAWLDAGANPGDESIPNGVRFAVHPDLRPTPKAKAKRIGKGYAQALRDLLDQDDPKAWATQLLAEVDA